MKRITLSILQFDADVKASNFEGIKKFINEFEPLYTSLFERYKYSESDFKKDVQEVFEYLFSDEKIFGYAFGKFRNEYGAIQITSERNPIVKKIYEIKIKHTPFDWSVVEMFKPDPLKAFVVKYQDRYKGKGLSFIDRGLIAYYEGEKLTKNKGGIYNWWKHYCKNDNRFRVNTPGKAIKQKERLKKIIPYLSLQNQKKAQDELNMLISNIDKNNSIRY